MRFRSPSPKVRVLPRGPPSPAVQATGRCPKCQSTEIGRYPSVRAGDGPLAVGDVYAGAFAVFSQFDAYQCLSCGYTEFYRKAG